MPGPSATASPARSLWGGPFEQRPLKPIKGRAGEAEAHLTMSRVKPLKSEVAEGPP